MTGSNLEVLLVYIQYVLDVLYYIKCSLLYFLN